MKADPVWPSGNMGRNPNPDTTWVWTESDVRAYIRRAGGWESLTEDQQTSLELARQRIEIAAEENAIAGHGSCAQRCSIAAGMIRAGLGGLDR